MYIIYKKKERVIIMKKRIIALILLVAVILNFAACGAKNIEFDKIADLAGATDEAVIELLGEGEVQYVGDTMLAREYTFKTLGKKCTASLIYKEDYVSQIALYYNESKNAFSQLNVELWNFYADPDSIVEGNDGSLNHIWITDDNNAVSLRKAIEGTIRVTVDASGKKVS